MFHFKAELTCKDRRPTSITLTPVGDARQGANKVTYAYQDAGGNDDNKTINFTAEAKTATLAIDPPVAHADHRMLTWFGYDDSNYKLTT